MTHSQVTCLLQHVTVDLEQHGLCEGEVYRDVLLVHPAVLQCMHTYAITIAFIHARVGSIVNSHIHMIVGYMTINDYDDDAE